MIKILRENWFSIVSIVLGFIGSYYFYRKQVARFVYKYETIKLMDLNKSGNLESIEIRYKDSRLERVLRTYISIWNDGSLIEGKNIVKKDPLVLKFEGEIGNIVYAKVIRCTKEINEVNVSVINEKEILFNFEYLDNKDGVVIEVIHTFYNPEIYIVGTIKGIPKGPINYGKVDEIDRSKKLFSFEDIVTSICIIAVIPYMYGGMASLYGEVGIKSFLSPIGVITVFFSIIVLWLINYKYMSYKRRIPKKLRY